MKTSAKFALGASAALTFAALGVVAPAQAATAHCDPGLSKVELDGSSATKDTDLPEGTPICIKAGTQVYYTTVGADGLITNDGIFNQNGNARGISYYVVYECEYPCGGGGTGT